MDSERLEAIGQKRDPNKLAVQYAILDDRQRPYYERRMAA